MSGRSAAVLLACSALAAAAGGKPRELHDSYWGLDYKAPELQETATFGDPRVVLACKCAGGIHVQVEVYESAEKKSAEQWRDAFAATLGKQDAKDRPTLEKPRGSPPRLLYAETGLGGLHLVHGVAFYARGHQCFRVEARGFDAGGGAVEAALKGLRLKPEGGTYRAAYAASQAGLSPDDPKILLRAGLAYQSGDAFGPPIPDLAIHDLRRALSLAKPDTFDADAAWRACDVLGQAYMTVGDAKDAVHWFEKAEPLSEKASEPGARDGISSYRLARAYAALGRSDEAFEALKRACQGRIPVLSGVLESDAGLDPLRKDPRWLDFYDKYVKGR